MLHSLYATLEMSLDRWSLLVGMRGGYAQIENQLISADTIVKQHYVNVYPTLYLSRQLNAHHELQFNYSLRVNRWQFGAGKKQAAKVEYDEGM